VVFLATLTNLRAALPQARHVLTCVIATRDPCQRHLIGGAEHANSFAGQAIVAARGFQRFCCAYRSRLAGARKS